MAEAQITVTMTPLEPKLFRRAIAKATDDGEVFWKDGLHRILDLERLRQQTEERQSREKRTESSDQKAENRFQGSCGGWR